MGYVVRATLTDLMSDTKIRDAALMPLERLQR